MKLAHRRLPLTARHTFQTARSAVSAKETILVELEHDGLVGLGEAVPSDLYGQSLESTEQVLAEAVDCLGETPFAIERTIARLIDRHGAQRAAIAALDSALYDWVGRRLATPVWRLLGLERARINTTFTIGIAPLAEIREKLDEALADGYTALKVKVGGDHDLDTLDIIRARFGGPLLLDGNQGWTPAEAPRRVRDLARFHPTLIEQPVPREDWRAMAELRDLGVAPIFADESCETAADVLRLQGHVDGVNIKFNKCGGIREALSMITVARALGMKVMLGCFLCSSLGIAPALAIATLVDFADLDGHLLVSDDPFDGIARDGATLDLGERPGLGVFPRG